MTLPQELVAYLSQVGRRLESLEEITTRKSIEGRRALRILLDDGSVIKARWLNDKLSAESWHMLREAAGRQAYFSDFMYRKECMVVEEWVEGKSVRMANVEEDILIRAAEALAHIHSIEIKPYGVLSPASEVRRAESNLHSLVHLKAISPNAAKAFHDLLQVNPPENTVHGLAHHDFCGENLVMNSSRGIVSIDHEWLCAASLEFDLSRAIFRWGLVGNAADCFVAAYKKTGGPASIETLPWWNYVNEIFAAEIRVRRGWPDAQATVLKLLARIGR
jgi:thiamine kinase-like enzyme